MTERLYYDDSFLREFDARILSCIASGDRWETVLDRTAFYPTSGGQPNDTGTIAGAKVLNVIDRESDHEVVHITDRALEVSTSARGVIDWPRRFDHLQQHTGQHLLSAAFIELFGIETVSFHLGREISTIDLAAAAVCPEQFQEAERRTNEIIFDDRPIRVLYGTAEELSAAGIRKKVQREGILRAIEVEGFDRQPCGGTHASATGQVGLILLRKLEKLKGNWRVEFVCGWRALAAARTDAGALASAAKIFASAPSDVPAVAARIMENRQATHRERQRLIEQLAALTAQSFAWDSAPANGKGNRTICRVLEEGDPGFARMVATKFVAEPQRRALLASSTGNIIFAQSDGGDYDLGALLRECLTAEGGKGGGSHDFAQGSVPEPSRSQAVLDRAMARLNG